MQQGGGDNSNSNNSRGGQGVGHVCVCVCGKSGVVCVLWHERRGGRVAATHSMQKRAESVCGACVSVCVQVGGVLSSHLWCALAAEQSVCLDDLDGHGHQPHTTNACLCVCICICCLCSCCIVGCF